MSLNDALEGGIDTDRRMRTIQTQPDGSAKRTALAEPESGGLHTRGIIFMLQLTGVPLSQWETGQTDTEMLARLQDLEHQVATEKEDRLEAERRAETAAGSASKGRPVPQGTPVPPKEQYQAIPRPEGEAGNVKRGYGIIDGTETGEDGAPKLAQYECVRPTRLLTKRQRPFLKEILQVAKTTVEVPDAAHAADARFLPNHNASATGHLGTGQASGSSGRDIAVAYRQCSPYRR
ncbi:hypothetical protein CPB85DRAFT_1255953 [Mucidula mucida]|nr:hypothetical protein CPB85DRAFT_1255953 [Mucidula mucida]